MSLGLGHKYWVHVVKHHTGDLLSCIDFMRANQPKDNYSWFELRPLANIVKGKITTCDEYVCDLVEDADNEVHL